MDVKRIAILVLGTLVPCLVPVDVYLRALSRKKEVR